MTPEEQARVKIDQLLTAAGWIIQDHTQINLSAALGIAVREYPLKSGFADYLLIINRKAAGVIEAKKAGTSLSGVETQTDKYSFQLPAKLNCHRKPLPFLYESTGVETYFTDNRDPDFCSRRVFSFHQPETLQQWLGESHTLRGRLQQLPEIHTEDLRECQKEALAGLFNSLKQNRPKALIQMATGVGKTYTSVSFIYWLIKIAGAKRVLFLVDRKNLGEQTQKEFQQYVTPDDGRKFTELYNVQLLTSNTIDPVNKVCITTIQRLYSMLRGEAEFEAENEQVSLFNGGEETQQPKDVVYNYQIPIETFDFIITDECHRSIYNVWRQVLDYFDAFIIGLTATPSLQTFGFFNQNLVMEYNHERAVTDGVNVSFEVYRIRTQITEQGSTIDSGFYVDTRNRQTRAVRWQQLDEEISYGGKELDRSVVAIDQIRTVIRTFKQRLFTEIFPDRTEVPKTLIFAKDDSHAEDIVRIVREEFGKGNEFCKKITYRTTGEKTENLIASFRNSFNPRIVVTVDMISTGTDIKPLECLIFMRDVKSQIYFEQMKGRGTRTINPTDFQAVTPGNHVKEQFVIVDVVGVCESDKTDSRPLERKRSIPFNKLLQDVAADVRDEDTLLSLAVRLVKLEKQLNDDERQELQTVAEGKSIQQITRDLLDALDVDRQITQAQQQFNTLSPTVEQQQQVAEILINQACLPFDNYQFRDLLKDLKTKNEQIIDNVSQDMVLSAGFDTTARDKARKIVETFRQCLEANKDEVIALQILYNQPYGQRQFTYQQIKELANVLKRPPCNLTPEKLWDAYAQLEADKVRGVGVQKLLTDIISLVRFAMGEMEVLEPFSVSVEENFQQWLAGRGFSSQQVVWLEKIKAYIITSVRIEAQDLQEMPQEAFQGYQLFGNDLMGILDELNGVLAA
ncbi:MULTISPECIES: DEAD/DEAH box helicase family protein [Cyanophyceae]|uniref:type I restriction endonuclease subunit R n=1 Tax=Cyanophyceae TaxID=3028117 RepID=UPI00232D8B09|nr:MULTISPECIES: DEAD/DEAH box helicase family protein [Cyanophyceae]MDB9357886.1 type I restriction-modification enzyme R subunit C-terminal domain-containing protein [Nodularia spumigena CS-587/03]MDB9323585.1 type I restriction-modification enzyme R subunit C-terminal domain-containing protein [Nodularia spumigena CS-591/07A]MDB9331532.1 type I restriction-modification enzyme R subunit C-terminal domain-containing protein [Nodularia spumigena CS-591/04]MDB9338612.1 type I restriction-modific